MQLLEPRTWIQILNLPFSVLNNFGKLVNLSVILNEVAMGSDGSTYFILLKNKPVNLYYTDRLELYG